MPETKKIHHKEPAIGTAKTKAESKRIITNIATETTRYGTTFARIISSGFVGDTNTISIVPLSFSRTIEIEVIIAQMSIKSIPMMAGTKL